MEKELSGTELYICQVTRESLNINVQQLCKLFLFEGEETKRYIKGPQHSLASLAVPLIYLE